ncbi:hypothetical protein ACXDJQ_002767, partial [Klebsiella pneumoniae]
ERIKSQQKKNDNENNYHKLKKAKNNVGAPLWMGKCLKTYRTGIYIKKTLNFDFLLSVEKSAVVTCGKRPCQWVL